MTVLNLVHGSRERSIRREAREQSRQAGREGGPFKSRSEALRRATEEFIERNSQLFLEDEARRWLGAEMEDEELEEIRARIFSGGSTAAEMVAEGRGR